MGIKQSISNMVPAFVKKEIRLQNERKQLDLLPTAPCDASSLRHLNALQLTELLNSTETEGRWRKTEKRILQFEIPDGTGGVNPGDRRAVYYLISAIAPKTVLEIGTHIGASTIHIASAIQDVTGGARLTTVDIEDVNSQSGKPWLSYGAKYSPLEMLENLGLEVLVEFVTEKSLTYMANCRNKFDFIFLDGSHAAAAVYQEVPAALSLLNENGVILLHDYFPDLKPLWDNGSVIPGPFFGCSEAQKGRIECRRIALG